MTSLSRYREVVWEAAEVDGDGHVYCNLCKGEVVAGDSWNISHVGAPAALGGTDVGVAHERCNERDNFTFVIPLVAKAKRMWRKHRGISGPGLGPNALPGGRIDNISKKLNG